MTRAEPDDRADPELAFLPRHSAGSPARPALQVHRAPTDKYPMVASKLRARLRDESGVVVVWVALLAPVILGMAAFTVDISAWYQQHRELQTAADAAALAAARDLPGSPSTAATDAQSYVDKNLSGATTNSTTPYSGDSATIQVTVSKPGTSFFSGVLGISAPTINATAVARNPQTTTNGSFFYAGSTACGAMNITHGGDNFTKGTLWSNGGITASGSSNTASTVFVGNSTCAFPSQLTPPGSTAASTQASWPQALPATPSPCTTSPINVNAAWLAANAPGVYCTTGAVSVGVGNTTISGYEFVSEASGNNAISVTQSGDTFTGVGTPSTIFYATRGGIAVNNPTTVNGDLFAPSGLVTFNGGTTVETGFIEASTINLNNGPYTFVGTGPIPTSAGNIALIG